MCTYSEKCTILYKNIQGLYDKVNYLSATANENRYDILCLSEHWLNDNEMKGSF